MAVALDAVSPDTSSAGNVSNLTTGSWTIAGANRLLLGFIGTGTGGTATTHSGMNWGGSGGTALTQIGSTVNAGTQGRLSAWRLTAPAAASQTLYGSWAATQDESAIGGVSLTGVDQTAPVGTSASNSGSILGQATGNMTVTVATTAGDAVMAVFWLVASSAANPDLTPNGTPTPTGLYEVETTALQYEGMQVQMAVATGTSTTMSCGFSSGAAFSGEWAAIAFIVNATAGTPIGLAAETDTALALSFPPVVGRADETDTALPLDGINFAQDGDLFLFGDDSGNESSMGGLKVFGGFLSSGVGLTIAQVSETDAAQSIAARQSRAIGQVAELNAAQALASPQAKALGQVAELDSAQAIASAQARAVAQIVETDAAQAVTLGASGSALGQVVENDAAQGLASPQRKAVAQIAETDAAQGLAATQTRAIGQAAELDAATALTQRQARQIGQAQEIDAATSVTGSGALQLDQQQGFETAQPLAVAQRMAIGLVLETDGTQALGASTGLAISQAVETDAAQAVQNRLLWQIQLLQEVDLAVGFVVEQEAVTPTWPGGGTARIGSALLSSGRDRLGRSPLPSRNRRIG